MNREGERGSMLKTETLSHGALQQQEMKAGSAQAESCCVYVKPEKLMQHMHGIISQLFDCWAYPVAHLLILKSSMAEWYQVFSALIIGTLRHALGREFEPRLQQTFFGPKHNIYTFFMSSTFQYSGPENTHLLRKGKYHGMTDLFDWLGFSCFASVELNRDLQFWSNANQSNRSVIQ